MKITIKKISYKCERASFKGTDDSINHPPREEVIILLDSITRPESSVFFHYECSLAWVCQTSQQECPYK